MRKYLDHEFDRVYVLDLGGNVRKNPKLSGTTHNVFGIQVGVAITLARKERHARHNRKEGKSSTPQSARIGKRNKNTASSTTGRTSTECPGGSLRRTQANTWLTEAQGARV